MKKEPVEKARTISIEMHLIMRNGEPMASYPRKMQAKVYATGFSKEDGIEIVSGTFTEEKRESFK
jgi:hypothetical protein